MKAISPSPFASLPLLSLLSSCLQAVKRKWVSTTRWSPTAPAGFCSVRCLLFSSFRLGVPSLFKVKRQLHMMTVTEVLESRGRVWVSNRAYTCTIFVAIFFKIFSCFHIWKTQVVCFLTVASSFWTVDDLNHYSAILHITYSDFSLCGSPFELVKSNVVEGKASENMAWCPPPPWSTTRKVKVEKML